MRHLLPTGCRLTAMWVCMMQPGVTSLVEVFIRLVVPMDVSICLHQQQRRSMRRSTRDMLF